jgi:hypothetical protein
MGEVLRSEAPVCWKKEERAVGTKIEVDGRAVESRGGVLDSLAGLRELLRDAPVPRREEEGE